MPCWAARVRMGKDWRSGILRKGRVYRLRARAGRKGLILRDGNCDQPILSTRQVELKFNPPALGAGYYARRESRQYLHDLDNPIPQRTFGVIRDLELHSEIGFHRAKSSWAAGIDAIFPRCVR